MAYDLRHEPWIPWLRRSGAVEWGPPAALVDRLRDDPVVGLSAPRPDFDGAMQEFLIGLLAVALHPEDEEAWLERWNSPPSPEELRGELDALPPAFDLDGDGPRFFQDISANEMRGGEEWSVESLLIDAPGSTMNEAQRRDVVTDLFVKPARVTRLGRPATAMALLTLQTYAPEGGRGHLTSMRGGGPLTTLVDPRDDHEGRGRLHEQPLWRKLWANVQTIAQWRRRSEAHGGTSSRPEAVFPWLAATRSAEPPKRLATTPSDVSPLQAYFGMPRRIRLAFAGPGRCDLTGNEDSVTVAAFRMRTYGVQYRGWQHPLSPYYQTRAGDEQLPVHGKRGGIAWRDWLGLTLRVPDAAAGRLPATVVADFTDRARRIGRSTVRLHAFGYAMSHKKAMAWTEAKLPVFPIPDPEHQRLLANAAARLTNATGMAATALLDAVRRALFDKPEDAPGDLSDVKAQLWATTEAPFFDAMRRVASAGATIGTVDDLCREFARTLSTSAAVLFDRWCSGDGIAPDAMRRLVGARFGLVMTLTGYSKLGQKLFEALGILAPGTVRTGRASKSRPRKEGKT